MNPKKELLWSFRVYPRMYTFPTQRRDANGFLSSCRNVGTEFKKPWAYNPKIVGFIEGTLIKAQGFLLRFLLVWQGQQFYLDGVEIQASD